jgi:hypothetical protein
LAGLVVRVMLCRCPDLVEPDNGGGGRNASYVREIPHFFWK